VEVSGGIKADISPDPLPLPREMSKQRNNYESWFTGHYLSPLQRGESYTDKNGCGTCFTTRMYENAVNSGLPPDKQLVRMPPPPVRRHHKITASGRDP